MLAQAEKMAEILALTTKLGQQELLRNHSHLKLISYINGHVQTLVSLRLQKRLCNLVIHSLLQVIQMP